MRQEEYEESLDDENSTNGICDSCNLEIHECDCESIVTCMICEDGVPRNHRCPGKEKYCQDCEEHLDNCECQYTANYFD